MYATRQRGKHASLILVLVVPWLTRGEPSCQMRVSRREERGDWSTYSPTGLLAIGNLVVSYPVWGALGDSFFSRVQGCKQQFPLDEQFWCFLPRQFDTAHLDSPTLRRRAGCTLDCGARSADTQSVAMTVWWPTRERSAPP